MRRRIDLLTFKLPVERAVLPAAMLSQKFIQTQKLRMISADHTERFYLIMPFSAAIWAQSFSSGTVSLSGAGRVKPFSVTLLPNAAS